MAEGRKSSPSWGVGAGVEANGALEGGQTAAGGGRGSAAQLAGGAPDENVLAGRIQHPVVALTGVVVVAGHLDEALVETEIVADRILPALLVITVVGKVLHDELVDAVKGESFFGRLPDGHHDERVVAVGRFFVFLGLLGGGVLGVVGGAGRR